MPIFPETPFFIKFYFQPISRIKLKIWYFTHFTINPKVNFLRVMNRKLPGWLLCVYSKVDDHVTFGLTPTWGPLIVGDEMGINDPIISIDNFNDAYYGFNGGLNDSDADRIIPNDIREWKKIHDKAIATHKIILSKGPNEAPCPECIIPYSGLTKETKLCPRCYGLGTLYTYGPQQGLGKALQQGLEIIQKADPWVKFQKAGLSALLTLNSAYHTGIVADIVRGPLIKNSFQIIKETFPNVVIGITYDKNEEPGLCDVVYDKDNNVWYRHCYLFQGDRYINLYTGKDEKPSGKPQPITGQADLPNTHRWNVTLDILQNLCKFSS